MAKIAAQAKDLDTAKHGILRPKLFGRTTLNRAVVHQEDIDSACINTYCLIEKEEKLRGRCPVVTYGDQDRYM
jgi:hypothetical protein